MVTELGVHGALSRGCCEKGDSLTSGARIAVTRHARMGRERKWAAREGCEAKWAKLVTVGPMVHSFVLFFYFSPLFPFLLI
jgi:hypothetical protein